MKMDMQQMKQQPLAKANQDLLTRIEAKIDANRKADHKALNKMNAKMNANQVKKDQTRNYRQNGHKSK
jgi:hypothetical protein